MIQIVSPGKNEKCDLHLQDLKKTYRLRSHFSLIYPGEKSQFQFLPVEFKLRPKFDLYPDLGYNQVHFCT